MAKGQGQGVVLGYLRYILGFDSLAFQEGVGDAEKRLKSAQKSMAKTADKFKMIGGAISAFVTAPMIGMAAAAVQGAKSQAAAMAQVDAAIASMGNQAKLSGDELSKFADQLELKSLFDADEILKKSTANLLTFGNVAGQNFKLAQQAAVDLATRMDGDLQAATLMIGKALNDPIKGLTALSRAGIQFSEQQKEQIKTMQAAGDVAGAQAIMLAELNKQFGGAAEAAAKADPMREVMVKLGQAGDAIGEKLLPIIPVLADALVSVLDAFITLSPETQKWVLIIAAATAALGPVVLAIGGMVAGVGALLPVLTPVIAAIGALAAVITTAVLPALGSLIVALSPFLVPLAAIAAAIGAVYLAWKNWDTIGPILQRLYTSVKTWLIDKLNAVWSGITDGIKKVADGFKWLWDVVVGHSYVPDLVDGVAAEFARMDAVMVNPATKATQTVAEKFQAMQQRIGGILAELFPATKAYREELEKLALIEADKSLSPDAKNAAVMKQRFRVSDAQKQADAEMSVPDVVPIAGALDDAWWTVTRAGENAAKDIQAANEVAGQSFVDMANKSLNALSNLAQSIKNGGVLDILSSAFNAFGQIAQSGILGKGLAGSFANFTAISGFRANGGPVTAGKSYIVGERGPERFTPSRSGYVHANGSNDNGGRAQTIRVVPSPYFNVVVDQRAAGVAAPMSVQAASDGSIGAQKAIARSNSRRLA